MESTLALVGGQLGQYVKGILISEHHFLRVGPQEQEVEGLVKRRCEFQSPVDVSIL